MRIGRSVVGGYPRLQWLVPMALGVWLGGCVQMLDTQAPDIEKLVPQIEDLMAREDVKGLAVATVENGAVLATRAFGYRNVEKALPLLPDTVMYGASLTKTAFAHLILQLVDEGRFDLDLPLADYLPKPLPEYESYADLGVDERWRQITGRHVLTHATGFPNFRWLEPDRKLRLHFMPGSRYAYSGEGFYLLQFVLEEGLGIDVGTQMQERVFDRFNMPTTSMRWRPDFADNLADGYAEDGSFEVHDKRSNVSAAGSMDTTIVDQGRMWAGISSGVGLSATSYAELFGPQLEIRSAFQFPTLRDTSDPRAAQAQLGAGLGLITAQTDSGRLWFKGGHNPWTGNMVVCVERRLRCVVLLSNSVRAERIYPAVVELLLGDVRVPWWWEYSFVD